MSEVLITGGIGYIGIHVVIELCKLNRPILIIDNLTNSNIKALDAVKSLEPEASIQYFNIDLTDVHALEQFFSSHQIETVIHLAALKAVGESAAHPLRYYNVNVSGTINLLQAMKKHNCRKIIFSSSACIYAEKNAAFLETDPLQPINVYGRTKQICEQIIADEALADSEFQAISLRYFNVVGAHPSGQIGEFPKGVPNNILPYIQRVATGSFPKLQVFGNDYDTPDGTCLRDYIHVVDLAIGHVVAMQALRPGKNEFNLGTGQAVSVLELINAYQTAVGKEIPWEFAPRRPGDAKILLADPSKAARELNWRASKTLADICADSWRWISSHPNGFEQPLIIQKSS